MPSITGEVYELKELIEKYQAKLEQVEKDIEEAKKSKADKEEIEALEKFKAELESRIASSREEVISLSFGANKNSKR